MLDYIKFDITHAILDWEHFLSLDYISEFNRNTGELSDKHTHCAENVKVTYYSRGNIPEGRITLETSLHKYYHSGFNHTDFTVPQVFEALVNLCHEYRINPFHAKILTLEVGANFVLPNSEEYIRNLYFAIGRPALFLDMKNDRHIPIGKELSGSDHRIKVYNKSDQLKNVTSISPNIVRYEDHYSRMRTVGQTTGVECMSDLLDYVKLCRLMNEVIKHAERLIFIHEQRPFHCSDSRLFEAWRNPLYLSALKNQNPRKFRSEAKEYRHANEVNSDSLYSTFNRTLKRKATQLVQVDQRSVRIAEMGLNQMRHRVSFPLQKMSRFQV